MSSRIEFRPDGEAVILDDSYHEVPSSRHPRRRLLSNGRHCIEVIAPGKKRNRWLAEYERKQLVKPETVLASEPLRKTVEPEIAAPAVVVVPEPVAPPVVPAVTEETETQQFYEAVAVDDGESWVPDPSDWYTCLLKFRLPNSFVVVGELTDGSEVWVHEREFTVRRGGHSICLPARTELFVRIEPNIPGRRSPWRAIEAQVLDDGEPQARTKGTVITWSGSLGGARMECGCSISIGTPSRDDQMDLQIGDLIEFDIVWKEKLEKHIGINIEAAKAKEQL